MATQVNVRLRADVVPAMAELYATASALHAVSARNYRRALHRHGAAHPTTVDARRQAAIMAIYLAAARTRYYRLRAAK